MLALGMFLAVRLASRLAAPEDGRWVRAGTACAAAAGLSLTNTPSSIAVIGPLALWTVRNLPPWMGSAGYATRRVFGAWCIAFVAGLLPYAALVVWSQEPKLGSWGDLTSVSGFLRHILGAEYGSVQLTASHDAVLGPFLQRLTQYLKYCANAGPWNPVALCLLVTSGLGFHARGILGASAEKKSTTSPVRSLFHTILFAWIVYSIGFHFWSDIDASTSVARGVLQRHWMQPLFLQGWLIGVLCMILLATLQRRGTGTLLAPASTSASLFAWLGVLAVHVLRYGPLVDQTGVAWELLRHGNAVQDIIPQDMNSTGSYAAGFLSLAHGGAWSRLQYADPSTYELSQSLWTTASKYDDWITTTDAASDASLPFDPMPWHSTPGRVVEDFGAAILASIPPDGLLLSLSDLQWNSVRYHQVCLGRRPDVRHVNLHLMNYPWFERQHHLYPNVTWLPILRDATANVNRAAYVRDLRRFVEYNLPQFPEGVFVDLHGIPNHLVGPGNILGTSEDGTVQLAVLPHGLVWRLVPVASAQELMEDRERDQEHQGASEDDSTVASPEIVSRSFRRLRERFYGDVSASALAWWTSAFFRASKPSVRGDSTWEFAAAQAFWEMQYQFGRYLLLDAMRSSPGTPSDPRHLPEERSASIADFRRRRAACWALHFACSVQATRATQQSDSVLGDPVGTWWRRVRHNPSWDVMWESQVDEAVGSCGCAAIPHAFPSASLHVGGQFHWAANIFSAAQRSSIGTLSPVRNEYCCI